MGCLTLSRDDVATLTHHFGVITQRIPLHPIGDEAQYEALPPLWCSRAASHGVARIVNIGTGLHI